MAIARGARPTWRVLILSKVRERDPDRVWDGFEERYARLRASRRLSASRREDAHM